MHPINRLCSLFDINSEPYSVFLCGDSCQCLGLWVLFECLGLSGTVPGNGAWASRGVIGSSLGNLGGVLDVLPQASWGAGEGLGWSGLSSSTQHSTRLTLPVPALPASGLRELWSLPADEGPLRVALTLWSGFCLGCWGGFRDAAGGGCTGVRAWAEAHLVRSAAGLLGFTLTMLGATLNVDFLTAFTSSSRKRTCEVESQASCYSLLPWTRTRTCGA